METRLDTRLTQLLAQQDIRNVLYRYCRGIDRRDYELVRDCYHPDATDDHGEYRGDLDGFIDHITATLPRFERTMHFLGNILVEVDGNRARSEAYAIAYHRLAANDRKPVRDFVVGFRYVDDFEERAGGDWRIANRICAFEWSRLDPVADSRFELGPSFVRGAPAPDDVVFLASLGGRF
jgi:hypothetical protein